MNCKAMTVVFGVLLFAGGLFVGFLGKSIQDTDGLHFNGLVNSESHGAMNDKDQTSYKSLYYWQLTANVASYTAILKRINQGDYETAKGVVSTWLNTDMNKINLATNYPWSEDQKKGIAYAQEYISNSNTN